MSDFEAAIQRDFGVIADLIRHPCATAPSGPPSPTPPAR